jgi:putative mRNA 3-end processing factor
MMPGSLPLREAVHGADGPRMTFAWRGGVRLLGSDLSFDAERASGLMFVSHGGVRANGPRLLATETAARVMRALRRRARPLPAPLGRPLTFGAHRLELISADRGPGAALLHVEHRGHTAIYAGCLGADADVRACDVLCLRAPEGPEGVSVEAAVAIVAGARDEVAILLVPGLPEAFAAARAVLGAGLGLRAHAQLRAALRAMGVPVPPFAGAASVGGAILWPLGHRRSEAIARVEHTRPVVLGATAASVDTMTRYARASGAGRVIVAGRAAAVTARALRDQGVPALPIGAPDQLDLFWGEA